LSKVYSFNEDQPPSRQERQEDMNALAALLLALLAAWRLISRLGAENE